MKKLNPSWRVSAAVGALGLAGGLLPLPAGSAAPQSVSLTATDKAISGMPASLKGGTTKFTLKNTGKQPHGLQLTWIVGTHSNADVLAMLADDSGKIPDWIHGAGGIGTVAPGATGSATVNLRKGAYIFWSDEGDEHQDFKAGLVGRFKTTSDKAAAEPTAAATIVAKEYGFDVKGLKAGPNTLAFSNGGKQLHHLIAAPFLAGGTIAAVTKSLAADPSDKNAPPPPLDFEKMQSTAVIDPGVGQVVQLNLPAGRYVFLCFLTDRAGGQPHALKGMLKEVVVK